VDRFLRDGLTRALRVGDREAAVRLSELVLAAGTIAALRVDDRVLGIARWVFEYQVIELERKALKATE
jgi:hypothetical protein